MDSSEDEDLFVAQSSTNTDVKQKSKANACTIKSFLPVVFFYLLKAAYPFFLISSKDLER